MTEYRDLVVTDPADQNARLHEAARPSTDLVAALRPRRMTVVGDFSVRGGIKTVITAEYRA